MEVSTFADIETEFAQRIRQAVYCSVATVDRLNRPRSRIMHPVWDGPIGWVISWPRSHKAKHLAHNPYVSLAYIPSQDKPVYVDCVAEWVTDRAEKQRIWELHKATPPPLGFDPQPHYGNADHELFGLLRFTPWRIELANLQGESMISRPTLTTPTQPAALPAAGSSAALEPRMGQAGGDHGAASRVAPALALLALGAVVARTGLRRRRQLT